MVVRVLTQVMTALKFTLSQIISAPWSSRDGMLRMATQASIRCLEELVWVAKAEQILIALLRR